MNFRIAIVSALFGLTMMACAVDAGPDAEQGESSELRWLHGQSCGGLIGGGCDFGEYCHYPEFAMCGAADFPGTCRPVPVFCTHIYAPVCGCDGNTYSNECVANAAGTSVAYSGECEDTGGGSCGGATCGSNEYCELPACDTDASSEGVCAPIPEYCLAIYDPVCGCDGHTYSNACHAAGAGVNIDHEGRCRNRHPR